MQKNIGHPKLKSAISQEPSSVPFNILVDITSSEKQSLPSLDTSEYPTNKPRSDIPYMNNIACQSHITNKSQVNHFIQILHNA